MMTIRRMGVMSILVAVIALSTPVRSQGQIPAWLPGLTKAVMELWDLADRTSDALSDIQKLASRNYEPSKRFVQGWHKLDPNHLATLVKSKRNELRRYRFKGIALSKFNTLRNVEATRKKVEKEIEDLQEFYDKNTY